MTGSLRLRCSSRVCGHCAVGIRIGRHGHHDDEDDDDTMALLADNGLYQIVDLAWGLG